MLHSPRPGCAEGCLPQCSIKFLRNEDLAGLLVLLPTMPHSLLGAVDSSVTVVSTKAQMRRECRDVVIAGLSLHVTSLPSPCKNILSIHNLPGKNLEIRDTACALS